MGRCLWCCAAVASISGRVVRDHGRLAVSGWSIEVSWPAPWRSLDADEHLAGSRMGVWVAGEVLVGWVLLPALAHPEGAVAAVDLGVATESIAST